MDVSTLSVMNTEKNLATFIFESWPANKRQSTLGSLTVYSIFSSMTSTKRYGGKGEIVLPRVFGLKDKNNL